MPEPATFAEVGAWLDRLAIHPHEGPRVETGPVTLFTETNAGRRATRLAEPLPDAFALDVNQIPWLDGVGFSNGILSVDFGTERRAYQALYTRDFGKCIVFQRVTDAQRTRTVRRRIPVAPTRVLGEEEIVKHFSHLQTAADFAVTPEGDADA